MKYVPDDDVTMRVSCEFVRQIQWLKTTPAYYQGLYIVNSAKSDTVMKNKIRAELILVCAPPPG